MTRSHDLDHLQRRHAPLDMEGAEFRDLGHRLVDRIADFMESLPGRPVTRGRTPSEIRRIVGDSPLPEHGADAGALLEEAATTLFDHSLFNGHPRFWGYITSSAAPIGALGDLLAASVNPNVGAFDLAPIATEIEAQTIRWIAELIGYPTDCGGVLVSGGNMANFVGFLAGRKARAGWDIRSDGLPSDGRRMRAYAGAGTHTWIQKAADLFGLGTGAIRWIPTGPEGRMDTAALEERISEDRRAGDLPFLVVGTAGTVGTGAVDPLSRIAEICRREELWFHVDGAYGAMAAVLPDAPAELRNLSLADSLALDPHKWLYSPIEAGCTLVRDPRQLVGAFSFHPDYYLFDAHGEEQGINFHEFSMQNSRGFRALKVWLALRQVGRSGYERMIADDVELARALHGFAEAHDEIEARTLNLSIATFRFVPRDLAGRAAEEGEYLNRLNREILVRLQAGGEAFVSNAVLDGDFVLRACIVNFRTTLEDVRMLPALVARLGHEVDAELRRSAPVTGATP
jgi:glutamate/tyrosine decarboxylase-like PLP-dependent enzyme